MKAMARIAGSLCLIFALACARDGLAHPSSPGARTQLTAAELIGGHVADFVDMRAFMPNAAAGAPSHLLTGRLVLGKRVAGAFHVRKNDPFDIPIDDAIESLPPFEFEFVQDGDAVIPVRRGPIQSERPNREYVLEPGLAWSEAADGGYTRVAIPFALQERNANCLHNGVLSFVWRGAGAVSDVFFEIAGETCAYFKFETWGLRKATFVRGAPPEVAKIIASYRAEVAARLPVRPLSDLIAARPQLTAKGFALEPPADGDRPTLSGVVVERHRLHRCLRDADGHVPIL